MSHLTFSKCHIWLADRYGLYGESH